MKNTVIASLAVAAAAAVSSANVIYTTGTYSQNFDGLAGMSGTWNNDTTLTGWHLTNAAGAGGLAYAAGTGTTTAGGFFHFGSSTIDADRALGGLGSGGTYWGSPATGAVAGYIALSITNGNAYTLTEFTLTFNGEQWRNGGNTSPQTMVLEYGFGATFATVGTWTAAPVGFNWTSNVNAASGAAVNGNSSAVGGGLDAGVGGTISGLNWTPGQALWFRWIERNDSGTDHTLAIDNVNFSAVPTPGSAALLGIGMIAAGRRRRA